MDTTTNIVRTGRKGTWWLFLLLLVVFLLAMWIWGLPPAPGSLFHIRSQWRPSVAIAVTTSCLLVASFWIYRRPGLTFRIQAVFLWLLMGPALFCSAYSAYQSLSLLRFEDRMRHDYEVRIDELYDAYASSSVEGAKKALQDMIELSLAEKKRARFYWRFDLTIAFSQARLALIAESQGETNEAAKLFVQASNNMVIQTKEFRQAMRKEGSVKFTDSDSEAEQRWTPDLLRKAVTELDKRNHVRWKSPNNSLEPTPTAPLVLTKP